MARYATKEELLQCATCKVWFALREAVNFLPLTLKDVHKCPNCDQTFTCLDNIILWHDMELALISKAI